MRLLGAFEGAFEEGSGYPVSVSASMKLLVGLLLAPLLWLGAPWHLQGRAAVQGRARSIPVFGYSVVKAYPHDRDAFTQGLQYLDGVLYEGTGLNGRSSLRRVRLETGEVLQHRDLAPAYFGEGITVFGDDLFQLTWQSGMGFVYDRTTFAPRRTFRYQGEGWGLTTDGTDLIMSDGTDAIRFLTPMTFAERRRIKVTAQGMAVRELNELEYVKGEIFANVWKTDVVARVDPRTGEVKSWVDLSGLLTPRERLSVDVLNGIAYDAQQNRLFVTGKLWPKLFEITISDRPR